MTISPARLSAVIAAPDQASEEEKNEAIVAMRADRERLDFLDRMNAGLNKHYGTTYRWTLILNHNVTRLMLGHLIVDLNDAEAHGLPSCRDAIDAEMERIESDRRARSLLERQP